MDIMKPITNLFNRAVMSPVRMRARASAIGATVVASAALAGAMNIFINSLPVSPPESTKVHLIREPYWRYPMSATFAERAGVKILDAKTTMSVQVKAEDDSFHVTESMKVGEYAGCKREDHGLVRVIDFRVAHKWQEGLRRRIGVACP